MEFPASEAQSTALCDRNAAAATPAVLASVLHPLARLFLGAGTGNLRGSGEALMHAQMGLDAWNCLHYLRTFTS